MKAGDGGACNPRQDWLLRVQGQPPGFQKKQWN